jgi:Flp pilus assembly pilin Flp
MNCLYRLVADDEGQDLIEYAFLCVFVALATLAGWMAIRDAMTGAYGAMDTAEQNIWRAPDPPAPAPPPGT